jgi:hypothetical protein
VRSGLMRGGGGKPRVQTADSAATTFPFAFTAMA